MGTTTTLPSDSNSLSISRGWLIVGGILSILVGFSAMGSPMLASFALARFLGVFALVSGIISFLLALFGKHKGHRVMEALLGIVRIAAGVILLNCLTSSVVMITLIFAIYLIVEGIVGVVTALGMRGTPGWGWLLFSGLSSLLLGALVYYRWPSNSITILGLFFGISLIMNGSSLLALGLAARKPAAA